METNLDHIYVFRTNIETLSNDPIFCADMNGHQAIAQWSVDCEDVDCVLRIVSQQMCAAEIINLVTQHGYRCEELA